MAANGENTLAIDLSSVVKITDSDGNSLTLTGGFTITIQDDVPVLTSATVSDMVEEDDLNSGQGLGNNEDTSSGGTKANGTLASLVSVGADELGTFKLVNNVSALLTLGLTSKGAALAYDVNVGTGLLTAYVETGAPGFDAADRKVFTLELESDGTYEFILFDQLDHPAVAGENLITIDLSSLVTFEDYDHDVVALTSGKFTIDVQDDIPILSGQVISPTVQEDDLNNAQSVGINEDGSVGRTVATGSLTALISVGADEPATFGLSADTSGLPALTSKTRHRRL